MQSIPNGSRNKNQNGAHLFPLGSWRLHGGRRSIHGNLFRGVTMAVGIFDRMHGGLRLGDEAASTIFIGAQ
jgi:hypothetical protein